MTWAVPALNSRAENTEHVDTLVDSHVASDIQSTKLALAKLQQALSGGGAEVSRTSNCAEEVDCHVSRP